MPRPAKFTADQILDATAVLVSEGGPGRATLQAIGGRLGAPTGSIYHRFASRDLLMAQLWVRTAERAQQGFLEALGAEDLEAAALHIPRWCRQNLDEARVMLLHRRDELAERWPEELGAELEALRTSIDAALRACTRRTYGRVTRSALQTVTFALVDVPYAAVRRFLLAGRPPPATVDELVITAARAVLPL